MENLITEYAQSISPGSKLIKYSTTPTHITIEYRVGDILSSVNADLWQVLAFVNSKVNEQKNTSQDFIAYTDSFGNTYDARTFEKIAIKEDM